MKPTIAKFFVGFLVGTSAITAGAAANKIIQKNSLSLNAEAATAPQKGSSKQDTSRDVIQTAVAQDATIPASTSTTGDTAITSPSSTPIIGKVTSHAKVSIRRGDSEDDERDREGEDD